MDRMVTRLGLTCEVERILVLPGCRETEESKGEVSFHEKRTRIASDCHLLPFPISIEPSILAIDCQGGERIQICRETIPIHSGKVRVRDRQVFVWPLRTCHFQNMQSMKQ